MKISIQIPLLDARKYLAASVLAFATLFSASFAVAGPASTTLPDTPVGKLGGALIQHINTDTPAQIRLWAPGILSSAIDAGDRASFVTGLASAARDSGVFP